MKKKLIAIVASLAMVATMVPATAFATTTPVKAEVTDLSSISIRVATSSDLSNDSCASWYTTTYPAVAKDWAFNEGISGEMKGDTLVLTGAVPYVEGFNPQKGGSESIYDVAEQNGHYIALRLRAGAPDAANITDWALSYSSEEKATSGSTVTTGTIDKLAVFDDFGADVSLKRLPESDKFSYTVYYLTASGKTALKKYAWNKSGDGSNPDGKIESAITSVPETFEALFGEALYTGANKNATKAGTNGARVGIRLQDAIYEADAAAEDIVGTATTNGIAASKTFTVDTSGLTRLNKTQTAQINLFTSAVVDIAKAVDPSATSITFNTIIADDNDVTLAYERKTKIARDEYNGLDTVTKAAVDKIVAGEANSTIKSAYKALEVAEDNVASYNKLTEVAAQIKQLPDAEKLELTDTAAVKQITAAENAVEKLAEGAKTALLEGNDYLTQKEIKNYKDAIAKIGTGAVDAVVKAIDALPALPTKFTDKQSVDTASEPFVAARKAFRSLSKENQAKVGNSKKLDNYETSYLAKLDAYFTDIYKKAAELNLDQPLTVEDMDLIREVKAYVEGEYYLDTDTIEEFKPAVYAALIAALDEDYDLGSASVAVLDTDNIVYDGTKKTPAVTVTDKAGKEIAADNYTVIYSDNKDAGEATVTVAAKGSTYTGSASATFTIKQATLTDAMVKSVANATYTGKAVTPAVTVDKGATYDVTYSNNTAVGKATATITGTGNYTGTITKNFIIKPAKEAISSLKAGKKSLTVAYKAQTGAKYRIVYSPAKGQAKAVNTTATKRTIKGLKAGKTYKVKVRAYKAIDGTTYNGTYSTVKKVKVK